MSTKFPVVASTPNSIAVPKPQSRLLLVYVAVGHRFSAALGQILAESKGYMRSENCVGIPEDQIPRRGYKSDTAVFYSATHASKTLTSELQKRYEVKHMSLTSLIHEVFVPVSMPHPTPRASLPAFRQMNDASKLEYAEQMYLDAIDRLGAKGIKEFADRVEQGFVGWSKDDWGDDCMVKLFRAITRQDWASAFNLLVFASYNNFMGQPQTKQLWAKILDLPLKPAPEYADDDSVQTALMISNEMSSIRPLLALVRQEIKSANASAIDGDPSLDNLRRAEAALFYGIEHLESGDVDAEYDE